MLFFQVTDPRAADYEIVNYILAIEQLTATMLRSVIGSMDLEQTLTSRDKINTLLRGVLDDASGKWGIRVTRVEIKAIDPPKSVKDAMEKQMRAEREKRAAILTAEGQRQSQILTAEGDKQSKILRAEGDKQAAILRAEGEAQAITQVFQSIHRNDPDPKLLAYQYLQTLPQLANGAGNTFWVIPSEVTTALKAVTSAFSGGRRHAPGRCGRAGDDRATAGQRGASGPRRRSRCRTPEVARRRSRGSPAPQETRRATGGAARRPHAGARTLDTDPAMRRGRRRRSARRARERQRPRVRRRSLAPPRARRAGRRRPSGCAPAIPGAPRPVGSPEASAPRAQAD